MTLGALGLIIGFTWLAAYRADLELRSDMLQQARLVAQALNIDHVKALTGTATDSASPDYQRLKAQLVSIGPANPDCKWFYLMGRRSAQSKPTTPQSGPPDDAIFFFVDSQASDALETNLPGQLYTEAPAGYRPVFDTKNSRVLGPVTNRWGVWVTALVPLIDPATGGLVAVLGMDIDATTWKWNVAARVVMPVGLMLALMIIVLASIYSAHPSRERHVSANLKPVLWRLLPPLTLIVILLVVAAGVLLWQQQRRQMANKIATDISSISSNLRLDLKQKAATMALTTQSIATDVTAQKALRAGDAEGLLNAWKAEFEDLRREQQLTHFYFMDAKRTCLLRVHKPELRNDTINRFTALKAEQSGKTTSGIELGVMNTLTLRVVQPVFDGTELVGYVELGKEIEDELHMLYQRSGNQVAVIVRKNLLKREAWADGIRFLGKHAEWDALPDSVVFFSSQGRLPDAFATMANQSAQGDAFQKNALQKISADGRDWWVSATPMKDASGLQIGSLLIMRDITLETAEFSRMMILGGTAATLLLVLLLSGIYVLLSHTDAGIRDQQAELLKKEEMFKSMVETMPVAIIMSDDRYQTIQYINPTMIQLFGYTLDDLQTIQHWQRLAYPDSTYRENIVDAWTALIDHQRASESFSHSLETEVTCKDGSKKTISWGYIKIGKIHYSYGLDLTARKLAENALLESLHEKDALFREIHHRVKNNLQIISSLLRLQSGKINNPVAITVLRDMQSRVRSMALIHEHLFRADNLVEVDLATYLDQLCHQLVQALVHVPGSIRLHLDLSPCRMDMDQAIHCGLLVNELVSNALKHAFPDKRTGELRVDLHPLADGHGWRLQVADNGIGLPPDFSITDLSSLGLKLVADLTQQIHAHLQIETGQGATFTIEFKTIRAKTP